MKRRDAKRLQKKIAKERIAILLKLATRRFKEGEENLARRYVSLAFAIVKRYKVKLKKEQKYSFCRKCFIPWIPGKTLKIIINPKDKVVEYHCLKCGYVRRLRYK